MGGKSSSKKQTKEPQAAGSSEIVKKSNSLGGGMTISFTIVLLAIVAYFLINVSDGAGQCTALPSRGLLSELPIEHNKTLLWGSYRPNVYFGMRSRTGPIAAVAGAMWGFKDASGRMVLRHQCQESDDLTKYGWNRHDGESFGVQDIEDAKAGLHLTTSFVKHPTGKTGGDWVARIEGKSLGGGKSREVSIFFYVGFIDDSESYIDDEDLNPVKSKFDIEAHPDGGAILYASSESTPEEVGPFTVIAPKSTSISKKKMRIYTGEDQESSLFLQTLEKDTISALEGVGKSMPQLSPQPAVGSNASLVLMQYTFQAGESFILDFALISDSSIPMSGAIDKSKSDRRDIRLVDEYENMSGDVYAHVMKSRVSKFDSDFEETFTKDKELIPFARYAFSALIGGMGYFTGSSLVKEDGGVAKPGPPGALFSAVPCRPFFPRGFMWDEGFHQLLVSSWKPALTRDVLSHWFELMRPNGWIPREQILGVEAVRRVPKEFMAQSESHANPPTFLLTIEKLLRDRNKPNTPPETAHEKAFFKAMLPSVIKWFEWFRSTQRGPLKNSFRWRGRDSKDGKLNAMTLSSGLDDYPRSSTPSNDERHLDLLCWMQKAASVIRDIATHIGHVNITKEYGDYAEVLATAVVPLHWNEKARSFHDYGLHDNNGIFKQMMVVRCNNQNGEGIEWMVERESRDPRSECPKSHPIFQFPLGDGQGGVMQREKYVTKNEKPRFVEHTGYVSIFPLMLRVLPVDSEHLGAVLNSIRDAEDLWTPWGLRSISKKSNYFQRGNAPGDAPYWRGPIWINIQWLALYGLHFYAHEEGPFQAKAKEIYSELRKNVIANLKKEWERTNYLWEQYSDKNGNGQRARPFNGWSSLVVGIMAEDF